MDKIDKIDWKKFITKNSQSIKRKEYILICELHAKYYQHRYYEPCTCNPKVIKTWIQQLNDIYEENNDNE